LLTLVEAGGLIWVFWVGADSLVQLPEQLRALASGLETMPWAGILFGAFLAFYAYTGFEDMVTLAEEVRTPERTLPQAILLALLASTVLYAGVTLVAILTVVPATLGASDSPLADVFAAATGEAPTLIALIAMAAVINGALIQIVMPSRMLYGMSRRGWLPAWLGRVHPRTGTPLCAVLLAGGVMLTLALLLPIVHLAAATSLLLLLVFSLVNAALLRIKLRQPAPVGVRVWPLFVPVLGLATALLMLVSQLLVVV
jgi:amino acid transporter